ncbi:exonuclease domain-containing protein [Roseobacteraceae bacterium S113]
MSEFWALDVETANTDLSSICQIGLVHYRNGQMADSWSSLIDPGSYFDPYNVSIHGISERGVAGAPAFTDVFDMLSERLSGAVLVHHGHFDRTAFARCYDRFQLAPLETDWLDNTKVVRRTWAEFSQRGYGLRNLAKHFGIELNHHDALSDANAAAQIMVLAIAESGKTLEELLEAVRHRITNPANPQDVRRDGDVNAPFFGEKIVFTGALAVKRSKAADVAQKLGFDVQNGVNKQTTFLCVGIQDTALLNGYKKSSKHRKAEALAEAGHEISFLSEDDFWSIAKAHDTGEV